MDQTQKKQKIKNKNKTASCRRAGESKAFSKCSHGLIKAKIYPFCSESIRAGDFPSAWEHFSSLFMFYATP